MGEPTGSPRRYTRSAAGVHLHVLDPTTGTVELPAEFDESALRWVDGSAVESTSDASGVRTATIPSALRAEAVAVLTASGV